VVAERTDVRGATGEQVVDDHPADVARRARHEDRHLASLHGIAGTATLARPEIMFAGGQTHEAASM
jgi:hypothetical protein